MPKKTRNSLNGTRNTYYCMDPNDVVIVGLDTGDGDEHVLYDDRIKLPLDRNLINNLKVEGNRVPILVRKDGGVAQVIDGRQRVRCARQANLELKNGGREEIKIRVILEHGDEDADCYGLLILANELRRNDSPMARARKVAKFIRLGRNKKDAAFQFGVTLRTIDLWLRLLDLDIEVQKAVDSGMISASNAGELADLPREEQVAKLKELLANGVRPNHEDVVKAKAGNGEPKSSRKPKRIVIKTLLDYAKSKEDDGKKTGIPDDAYAALLWMDGKISPSDVPWLVKILRKLEEESSKDLMSLAGTGPASESVSV